MGLIPDKLSDNNLEAAVIQLIKDFKSTGMKIDVAVNGSYTILPTDHLQALFRLCQEALTNALRHGKADQIDIVMNFTESRVKVLITDNGVGCRKIVKGYGLTGMEERITGLGGTIHYGSDGESGFNIFVELPPGALSEERQKARVGA
jgi:signal transduction histidine kinase